MKTPAGFRNRLAIRAFVFRRQRAVPVQSGADYSRTASSAMPRSGGPDNKTKFHKHSWQPFAALRQGWVILFLLCIATFPSSAQDYTILHSFDATALGSHPYGGLVQGPDGTLYGTTSDGGAVNNGTVFKINTDGTGYTVLHSFTGADGSNPQATLVLSGTTLYGTAPSTSWYPGGGMVFKLNVDGSNFAVIKQFNVNTGETTPTGGLVLSGTTLYGTTQNSASGYGTLFKVNTDGSGYAVLRTFSGTDGGGPRAALLLDGGTLYGTTSEGGSFPNYNCGTVFKVNTDGSGFALLRSFTVTDGDAAFGSLMLSGGTLYGTTVMGGDVPDGSSDGNGTVFKINTDGSGFALLKTFTGNDGANPYAGLLLAGQPLFGTTAFTSTDMFYNSEGYGTIFGINTDGTGFTVLKTFSGTDGANPRCGLLPANGRLYGTTSFGGGSNNGVVFSLTLPTTPPYITLPPSSQTAETGAAVSFSVEITNSPGSYQWYFNGTNALSGATHASLRLPNVQTAESGAYTVVVRNYLGGITSPPALLSVIAPVERRSVPALQLTGDTSSLLHLEYSDNLVPPQWLPLSDVTLRGGAQACFDPFQPLPSKRFYRVWQWGTPGVVPSVSLSGIIPAITLTGNVGNTLRLDYINQFGPTDAWRTLDTVTLTNTSQLYFDTSSIGQPARLWRIVPVP